MLLEHFSKQLPFQQDRDLFRKKKGYSFTQMTRIIKLPTNVMTGKIPGQYSDLFSE